MQIDLIVRDTNQDSINLAKAVSPQTIVFPVDIAGPLAPPPNTSTIIKSPADIVHGVDLDADIVAKKIEQMREMKRKKFVQALDAYTSVEGLVPATGVLVPASVMLSVESTWDFIYPELISSIFAATTPDLLLIDIGSGAKPFERAELVSSTFFKISQASGEMDRVILNHSGILSLQGIKMVGLITSTNDVKEVNNYIQGKPNFFVAPFIHGDVGGQLEYMNKLMGDRYWQPVIANVPAEEQFDFHNIVGRYGNTVPIFWSPSSMENVDTRKTWYETVPVKMITTGTMWERKNRNSHVTGIIPGGREIDIKISNTDGDICWAEVIDKDNGKSLGFMIWSYQGQDKVTFL